MFHVKHITLNRELSPRSGGQKKMDPGQWVLRRVHGVVNGDSYILVRGQLYYIT